MVYTLYDVYVCVYIYILYIIHISGNFELLEWGKNSLNVWKYETSGPSCSIEQCSKARLFHDQFGCKKDIQYLGIVNNPCWKILTTNHNEGRTHGG